MACFDEASFYTVVFLYTVYTLYSQKQWNINVSVEPAHIVLLWFLCCHLDILLNTFHPAIKRPNRLYSESTLMSLDVYWLNVCIPWNQAALKAWLDNCCPYLNVHVQVFMKVWVSQWGSMIFYVSMMIQICVSLTLSTFTCTIYHLHSSWRGKEVF